MNFLNIFKLSAKILAFTQFSAYAYSTDSYQNSKYEFKEDNSHTEKKNIRSKRSLLLLNFWDGGKVYFFFDSENNPHSEEEKNRIRLVMRELEGEANIYFEEISDQNDNHSNYKSYIRITNIIGDTAAGVNAGCYVSDAGVPEGEGFLNLSTSYSLDGDLFSCFKSDEGIQSNAAIRHELLHILGFEHEHIRPEQREKINFNFKSLRKIYQNPDIISANLDPLSSPLPASYLVFGEYDYTSIMHYHSYAGASKEAKLNKNPFVTKNNGELISYNEFLSQNDKFALRRIYGSLPSKILQDSEGNNLQYCKLYKIDYAMMPEKLGAWKYIISAVNSKLKEMNSEVNQDSLFGEFVPVNDQKLCSDTIPFLKSQDIKIHLEIEKDDIVKLNF